MTDLCPVTAAATSAAARTGLSLSGLREVVPGVELQGGDPVLRGVTHRSGAVRSGFLFAALPGARGHGASFAAEAVTRGAAAVLTDPAGMRLVRDAGVTVPLAVVDDPRLVLGVAAGAVLGDPGRDLALVGVTGTNGKTTTTYLVDAALRSTGMRTGLVGTVEYRAGDLVLPSRMTSPDAPDLQELLALMRAEEVQVTSMECSSHALDQHRLGGLCFDVVAFTNLTREHLDYHGTMEDYYAAKARLFEPGRAKTGVVLVDDPWGRRLARETRIPVVTLSCGIDGDARTVDRGATWRAVGDLGSDDFVLSGPVGDLALTAPLPGEHNRIDAAVAAVVLLHVGLSPQRVVQELSRPVVVPGRMQRLDLGPGAPRVLVDFVHTPDGMRKAARSLRYRTPGRLVVTVGAGGERDVGKRRPIGWEAAMSGADVLVVTDEHPRSEDPAVIRAAVLEGVAEASARLRAEGRPSPTVIEVGDGRRHAMAVALDAAGPDGTVGFFGLGPDREQHIGLDGARVPFVETDEIRAAWGRLVGESTPRTEVGV